MHLAFFFSLFIVLTAPLSAGAQTHDDYCDRAESTAETLTCINRHREAAQDDLAAVFDKLLTLQPAALQKPLLDSQKAWLAYRDAECAWESGWADADSLERLYELSCVTGLTENRAADLAAVLDRETTRNGPREFGASARWINILNRQYPDIFWQTSHGIETDLNCDNVPEQVVAGIDIVAPAQATAVVQPSATETSQARAHESYQMISVIAIADNPVAGRPDIELLALPADTADLAKSGALSQQEKDQPHLCSPAFSLSAISLPETKPAGAIGDAETKKTPSIDDAAQTRPNKSSATGSCRASLRITDLKCRSYRLKWGESGYSVSAF